MRGLGDISFAEAGNVAQGVAFNFGRIAAGLGAITGAMVGRNFAQIGTFVSLMYVLGKLLIWLAPETKGEPLPE